MQNHRVGTSRRELVHSGQRRVVGVAVLAGRVEGAGIGRIQRSTCGEALGQIGIGDEELAKGDGVGFARGDRLLGRLLRELLIRNPDAAEGLFQFGTETIFAQMIRARR